MPFVKTHGPQPAILLNAINYECGNGLILPLVSDALFHPLLQISPDWDPHSAEGRLPDYSTHIHTLFSAFRPTTNLPGHDSLIQRMQSPRLKDRCYRCQCLADLIKRWSCTSHSERSQFFFALQSAAKNSRFGQPCPDDTRNKYNQLGKLWGCAPRGSVSLKCPLARCGSTAAGSAGRARGQCLRAEAWANAAWGRWQGVASSESSRRLKISEHIWNIYVYIYIWYDIIYIHTYIYIYIRLSEAWCCILLQARHRMQQLMKERAAEWTAQPYA